MLKVLSNILCDLDPKVKVIGQKAGICDGVPSTSALVFIWFAVERNHYPKQLTLENPKAKCSFFPETTQQYHN